MTGDQVTHMPHLITHSISWHGQKKRNERFFDLDSIILVFCAHISKMAVGEWAINGKKTVNHPASTSSLSELRGEKEVDVERKKEGRII